jgi:NAD(P)-dependent dehydrogenase (short-subunit alcohol dehydrogenase family)
LRRSGDTAGRVVVITGASSGIGAAAAQALGRRGATVVPLGRSPERLAEVADRVRRGGGVAAEPVRADFASMEEVRRAARELLERHDEIHVLVNNAGLVMGRRELTRDGFETTFAVNHLAPFLLTNLLVDRLRASAPARIVTTSSDAHASGRIEFADLNGERSWSLWSSYCNSKLSNILFTRELARKLRGDRITANCLHPGVIRTRLGRSTTGPVGIGWRLIRPFFGSPKRGAATIVHLAADADVQGATGGYFVRSRRKRPAPAALDDATARRLWEVSERMVGLAAETKV